MLRRLTFERTAIGVTFLIVFGIAVIPAVDNDTWWHIRTGQWILDHHAIPGADPFNHTRPTVVRVATDWLSQVSLAGLWSAGGRPLIAVVAALVITAGVAVVFRTTSGPLVGRIATTLLAALAASYFWAARPQIVTFLCTAIVVLACQEWRLDAGRRWLWWLVPLFAVWANFHGAVVYGFIVLGATVVGDRVNLLVNRHAPLGIRGVPALPWRAWCTMLAVSVTCVAAVALNPSGGAIYGLAFHQTSVSLKYIQEVQPPALADAFPFYVMLILTVAVMARRWRDLDAVDVLLIGTVAVLALRVGRVVSFFAEVAAGPLSRYGTATFSGATDAGRASTASRAGRGGRSATSTDPVVNLAVLVVVAVLVVATTAWKLNPSRVETVEQASFPVGAVAWINANDPPQRLFNTFNWGGYVLLFARDYRVSIDPRADVYDDFLETYVGVVTAAPGWQAELDREAINTVLIDTGAPLAQALRRDNGWRSVYEDPVATVFVRTPARSVPVDGVSDAPG